MGDEVDEFFDFLVNDFLVTGFAAEDQFVDVLEVLEFVEDYSEVAGEGVFEGVKHFELGFFDGLLVDRDGLALLLALDDFQDEVDFQLAKNIVEHTHSQPL